MSISNGMKSFKLPQNPYLLFSPFLILFLAYVLIFHSNAVGGDGPRYLKLTENLLKGNYSPPAPDINLPNGPGYPIFLIPFMAFGLPLICVTILHAVLHYLSIVLLFKSLRYVVSFRLAFIVSLFWGCYYIAYQNMSAVTTETLSMFLITLFLLCTIKAFQPDSSKKIKRYVILAGLVLGYLALVKIIFGYVLLFMLIGCLLLWALKRTAVHYRRGTLIILIAFAVTVPYLIYTYSLTGRMLYWGTGSDNLYWMSSPYEDEFGDWKGDLNRGTIDLGNWNIPGSEDTLKAHHGKDFEEANRYVGLEKDDVFNRIAINNIKSHPVKYVKNIFYNIGRMLFHYPYSYAIERRKSLLAMPINGIVLTFILLSLIPTFINWRKIIYPLRLMLFLTLIYMGASCLLSSDLRMFALIVPIVLFWVAYILERSVKINLKFHSS